MPQFFGTSETERLFSSVAREPPRPTADARSSGPDAEGHDVFRRIHEILFEHPGATQAAFKALAAEGREFANTAEGAELARRLHGSDLAARARTAWEVVGMSAFTEHESGLPSVVLNEFARAISVDGLERTLARLFEAANIAR